MAHALDGLGRQTDLLAHQRVRRQAVIATGLFAHCQLDGFDFLGRQGALAQRAIQMQGRFQGDRAERANAGVGIGHHADSRLDGGKQLGGLAGGFGNGGSGKTGHDSSPVRG